jgi:HEPN domain-containing protein
METTLWLKQSDADLKTARQLLADEIYYACVFFAHQTAEKALKALWIEKKGEFPPKTCNLVTLVRKFRGDEALIDAAAELTPEYILTRYPSPEIALPKDIYTHQSANTHLQAAERIVKWAKSQLGQ